MNTVGASRVRIAKLPMHTDNVSDALALQLSQDQKTTFELEAWSPKKVVPFHYNAFVATSNACYAEHRPLIISPDSIWLLIVQGLANHINENSEALRYKIVDFDGKEKIIVEREPDFLRGNPDNDWPSIVSDFDSLLEEYIGDHRDLIMDSFSTTEEIERTAFGVTMMYALKSYFSYEVHTRCGIPSVTLEGDKADWEDVATRAEEVGKRFELNWWTEHLMPVLEQCISAFDKPNPEFWAEFYKQNGGSGGPYVSGHILNLFPYLKDYKGGLVRNELLGDKKRSFGGVIDENFPSGLSICPFIWKILTTGEKFDMRLISGFVGASQDEDTLGLKPEICWAVAEIKTNEGGRQ